MIRKVFSALLAMFSFASVAQEISTDTRFRVGTLDNGLHYYVCANSYVPKRADFFIVQNVGAILEQPSQRGLAHFLEHMAFNGTTHFPDKQIINYLESIGVKFGANLNAYTGVDETVYMIREVPVVRNEIVDSCLLILRDWADGISLDEKEIDKERGVIEEEWRTRDGSMSRMFEKILPAVFRNEKYADCMPIGSIDVIRNFQPDTLRSYYKTWYRPDLQGIIVVGDIDADSIVKKIETMFASCVTPQGAPKRIWYSVSDNDTLIYVSASDAETQNVVVALDHKMSDIDKDKKDTYEYILNQYIQGLSSTMIDKRLEEIKRKPSSPYSAIYTGCGQFMVAATKKSFSLEAVTTGEQLEDSYITLLTEVERAYRYGFTRGEIDRARAEVLKNVEQQYQERNNQYNGYYVNRAKENFTQKEPLISIEDYLNWLSNLPQEATDVLLQPQNPIFSSNNRVVTILSPEKDEKYIPTKERLIELSDSILKSDIAPYVDEFVATELVGDITVGSIRKERKNKDGSYSLKLSNGVNVIVKPTTLKDDEVLLSAVSKGGMSAENYEDALQIRFCDAVSVVGGLGSLSEMDLSRQLAGKNARMSLALNTYTERISGSSSVKDIETMLQLLYLKMTNIRRDDEAFSAFINNQYNQLLNDEADPDVEFSDTLISVVFNNHPLVNRIKAVDLNRVDYTKALEIEKRRFSNAADFTFVIVGNVDINQIRPVLCKYVASLPSNKSRENWKNLNIVSTKNRSVSYAKKMVNPKTSAYIRYGGTIKYNEINSMRLSILSQVLNMIYFESVREADGGTYGVHVGGNIQPVPFSNYALSISFDTDSTKINSLLPIIYSELDNIVANGLDEVKFQNVKSYMVKAHNDAIQKNSYWNNYIINEKVFGLKGQDKYLQTLSKCSAKSIQNFLKTILKKSSKHEIIQIGTY